MPKRDPRDLTFAFAKPEQSELIAQFVNAAYRGESSRVGWTTEADLLNGQRADTEMIKEVITKDDHVILLAYENQTLVGCVALELVKPATCHLGMLTVKPNLQNQGIGTQLLSEAESYARSKKCEQITMGVITLRTELIDWYKRKGYQPTGEREAFPYHDQRFGIPLRQDLSFLLLNKKLK